MNTVGLYTALTMGFLGSLHCAGMCGPIMLILPFQFLKGWKKVAGITFYHFGRISVYALMGMVLHSFRALFRPDWQQAVSVILGVSLLVAGILSFISMNSQIKLPWMAFVKNQLGKVMGRPELHLLFAAGLLNGLLPCGLVYMALSVTATASSSWAAAATMYAFGLGTIPMLLTIIILKAKSRMLPLQSLRRFVPVLMLFFGLMFMVRGMNLGIPYFSPKITMEKQAIESNCCHEKPVNRK